MFSEPSNFGPKCYYFNDSTELSLQNALSLIFTKVKVRKHIFFFQREVCFKNHNTEFTKFLHCKKLSSQEYHCSSLGTYFGVTFKAQVGGNLILGFEKYVGKARKSWGGGKKGKVRVPEVLRHLEANLGGISL